MRPSCPGEFDWPQVGEFEVAIRVRLDVLMLRPCLCLIQRKAHVVLHLVGEGPEFLVAGAFRYPASSVTERPVGAYKYTRVQR